MVAREHLEPGQQVVAEGHRLRGLQVSEAGHDGVGFGLGQLQQARLQAVELDEVVVTRSTSPRAMRPERLGEIAAEVFGDHRVTVVDALPDALDHAAQLADEGGVAGGVVATGSIVTVGEVRLLLGVTDVERPVAPPVEVPVEVEDED